MRVILDSYLDSYGITNADLDEKDVRALEEITARLNALPKPQNYAQSG